MVKGLGLEKRYEQITLEYPQIQSKKAVFWAQGIETCSHDCIQ
jgi:hypothetical protein